MHTSLTSIYFLKQISTFDFVHRRFNSTAQHVNGMNEIYQMIEELQFTNSVFPITQQYANWETDAVRFFYDFFDTFFNNSLHVCSSEKRDLCWIKCPKQMLQNKYIYFLEY